MATYYIDFDAGDDAANGTSTSTPWKHCPGDPNATGNAATTTLEAGDVVDFRKGVSYVASYAGIILGWSGSEGNPITYTSTWGTGDPARLTTNNQISSPTSLNGSANLFDDNGSARSFITISGITFEDIGGIASSADIFNGLDGLALSAATDTITKVAHGLTEGYLLMPYSGTGGFTELAGTAVYAINVTEDTFQVTESYGGDPVDFSSDGVGQFYLKLPPGGDAIDFSGGGQGLIVEDCVFNRCGTWQGTAPLGSTTGVSGRGVRIKNNSDVIVRRCDFSRMANGVTVNPTVGCDNILIQECTFSHNMNWLIDVAPTLPGATLNAVVIDGCDFYDYAELDYTQWTANGAVGDSPHQDGIFFRTATFFSTWTNCVIRNCRFWKDDQNTLGGTASIFVSGGPSVDIYNCVFRADKHANAHVSVGYRKVEGMTQSVRVWNCSFEGEQVHIKCSAGNSNPDLFEVKNCAVSGPGPLLASNPSETGTLDVDYNVALADDPDRYATADLVAAYYSFADWQTTFSQDANSSFEDPGFTATTGDASTWDLSPAPASPLIGAGDDLSAYFTTDIDGNVRGTWDIGAYAYDDSIVTPPAAPTNLTVTAI